MSFDTYKRVVQIKLVKFAVWRKQIL